MNKILEGYARGWLLGNLSKCTEAQQDVFKRMYSHKDLSASVEDVIVNMPVEKLDWAMQQVEQTIRKGNAA